MDWSNALKTISNNASQNAFKIAEKILALLAGSLRLTGPGIIKHVILEGCVFRALFLNVQESRAELSFFEPNWRPMASLEYLLDAVTCLGPAPKERFLCRTPKS